MAVKPKRPRKESPIERLHLPKETVLKLVHNLGELEDILSPKQKAIVVHNIVKNPEFRDSFIANSRDTIQTVL